MTFEQNKEIRSKSLDQIKKELSKVFNNKNVFINVKKGASYYLISLNTDRLNNFKLYAIFDKDFNRLSNWYHEIYADFLLNSKSDYYLVKHDNKYAIFHIKNGRISDWFDDIYFSGLLKNQSDYFIAKRLNKKAVFDKNGKQISDWYDDINVKGLVDGSFEYIIAYEEKAIDDEYIIFNIKLCLIDKNGNELLRTSKDPYLIIRPLMTKNHFVLYKPEFQIGYNILDVKNNNLILENVDNLHRIELESLFIFDDKYIDIRKKTIKKIIENENKYLNIIKYFEEAYKQNILLHELKGFEDLIKLRKLFESIIKNQKRRKRIL